MSFWRKTRAVIGIILSPTEKPFVAPPSDHQLPREFVESQLAFTDDMLRRNDQVLRQGAQCLDALEELSEQTPMLPALFLAPWLLFLFYLSRKVYLMAQGRERMLHQYRNHWREQLYRSASTGGIERGDQPAPGRDGQGPAVQ